MSRNQQNDVENGSEVDNGNCEANDSNNGDNDDANVSRLIFLQFLLILT